MHAIVKDDGTVEVTLSPKNVRDLAFALERIEGNKHNRTFTLSKGEGTTHDAPIDNIAIPAPLIVRLDCDVAPTNRLDIITDDNRTVYEGDRVFSHYTCKWGVITNPTNENSDKYNDDYDGSYNPHTDVWFTLKYSDGIGDSDYLNGQRIATHKPAWMS